MSAETIARWEAIPLERSQPEPSATQSLLKRPRSQHGGDDDDSEDNVSLVSRSPSPPPPDAMDIDKYDEFYAQKPEREVITVETKIKNTNIGFSMLAKMGWVEGSPLGLSGNGRVDPIPFYVKNDLTGLGKANQDVRMIESTVSQRRELDSERQTKETEEQRRQREDAVAKRAAVKTEISTVLRPFYCEVCEKQFQNVGQYDEHTNSYAHHHKVRFRDMQAAQRASRNTEEEVNKRKEKERKREEKELRKIAKAAGIKMVKPSSGAAPESASAAPAVGDSKPSGFKKGSWAAVSTPTAAAVAPPTPSEPPKRSNWASVGDTPSISNPSVDVHPPSQPTRASYGAAPAFRTGGWTSLETSSGPPPSPLSLPPQSSPPPAVIPPPRTFNEPHSGVVGVPRPPTQGGWSAVPPAHGPPSIVAPIAPMPLPTGPPQPHAEPVRQETSRSGWQKFRAGAPGRKR